MKRLLISALFCVSSVAMAGDAARLTHIGASADGSSLAFMESGINDGMGNAYASVRVIDTLNNKYLAPAFDRVQTEEEMENQNITLKSVEADAMKKAESLLKKLNITSATQGTVVASRKVTDLEARKLKELTFSTSAIIGGLISPTYTLKLTESKATAPNASYCLEASQARKIKLEITDHQTKKTRSLQTDSSLPSSRGCAHKYEIEDVIVTGDYESEKVVVLLRVFTYGFEGENVRYMAVSGSLK